MFHFHRSFTQNPALSHYGVVQCPCIEQIIGLPAFLLSPLPAFVCMWLTPSPPAESASGVVHCSMVRQYNDWQRRQFGVESGRRGSRQKTSDFVRILFRFSRKIKF